MPILQQGSLLAPAQLDATVSFLDASELFDKFLTPRVAADRGTMTKFPIDGKSDKSNNAANRDSPHGMICSRYLRTRDVLSLTGGNTTRKELSSYSQISWSQCWM